MSKICAHRGMLKQKTENTISSFKEAMKYDIDSIELDVHLTKDNKLVVFHDFTLERMCDINEYIGELTYDEIKKIYCDARSTSASAGDWAGRTSSCRW